jgi:hypothetical protein
VLLFGILPLFMSRDLNLLDQIWGVLVATLLPVELHQLEPEAGKEVSAAILK